MEPIRTPSDRRLRLVALVWALGMALSFRLCAFQPEGAWVYRTIMFLPFDILLFYFITSIGGPMRAFQLVSPRATLRDQLEVVAARALGTGAIISIVVSVLYFVLRELFS